MVRYFYVWRKSWYLESDRLACWERSAQCKVTVYQQSHSLSLFLSFCLSEKEKSLSQNPRAYWRNNSRHQFLSSQSCMSSHEFSTFNFPPPQKKNAWLRRCFDWLLLAFPAIHILSVQLGCLCDWYQIWCLSIVAGSNDWWWCDRCTLFSDSPQSSRFKFQIHKYTHSPTHSHRN